MAIRTPNPNPKQPILKTNLKIQKKYYFADIKEYCLLLIGTPWLARCLDNEVDSKSKPTFTKHSWKCLWRKDCKAFSIQSN
jgi:hypothetical protein